MTESAVVPPSALAAGTMTPVTTATSAQPSPSAASQMPASTPALPANVQMEMAVAGSPASALHAVHAQAGAGTAATMGGAGELMRASSGGAGSVSAPIAAAGSGGSNMPASAAAGMGGAGSAAVQTPHADLGKGDGRDVVLIGDSWMSNTLQLEGTGGGISPSLRSAAGQPYRNYAVQGVMLLSADAFGPAIPTQWDSAKRIDPDIKTVVMTGGGNDVIQNPGLLSDCQMDGQQCKEFQMKMTAALDKLWAKMADDGVQDIIYIRYAARGDIKQTQQTDAAPVPACTTGKVRCHSLETTELVMGQLAPDNIHPLFTANDRIAKALVQMMEKEGMRR